MRLTMEDLIPLVLAFAIFSFGLELGFRLGLRRQASSDEPDRTLANGLNGAVLGLLALLLGFTFAMAVSRYETRKTLMVDQANAVGTAALRARLLPAAQGQQALRLLREYVDSRLQYNAAGNDDTALNAAETRGNTLENQLWEIGRVAITEDPRSQPASLYIQVMNDVIDLREKRRFALNDQVPGAVTFLLYAVAFAAMGLVAYSCGLTGRRRTLANLTFAFLIALVLVTIMDIDRPRRGFVIVSQESLIRLQQSLGPPTP